MTNFPSFAAPSAAPYAPTYNSNRTVPMGDMIDRDAALATIQQQLALWESGTLVCGLDDLLRLYLPQAIAALKPVTVGVKPLVWKQEADNAWVAAHYAIHQYWPHNNGLFAVSGYLGGLGAMSLGKHPTLEAAKAAAQADYEARILAALEPQPVLTANPVDDSQTPDPAVNDPVCTDCGGTGITYQTERRCACQGPDLSDPTAVHINMLRGTIAKPTVEQIIHLYGVDALAKALASIEYERKVAQMKEDFPNGI